MIHPDGAKIPSTVLAMRLELAACSCIETLAEENAENRRANRAALD